MNMLNRIIVFIIFLLNVNCSNDLTGKYYNKNNSSEKLCLTLVLFNDSTYLFTKQSTPSYLTSTGNWYVKNNTLILKPYVQDTVLSVDTSSQDLNDSIKDRTSLQVLPVRRDIWNLSIDDFNSFRIRGRRIITTYRDSVKIVLIQKMNRESCNDHPENNP